MALCALPSSLQTAVVRSKTQDATTSRRLLVSSVRCRARPSPRGRPSDSNRSPNDGNASPASGSEASSSGQQQPLKLPKRGLFAIADTKAEVYSKAGEKFDPTQKPGRWKPEFIWNTKWQEALAREEALQRSVDEANAAKAAAPKEGGFLSLSRVAGLEDMNVDLTDVLVRKRQEDQALAAAKAAKAEQQQQQQQRRPTPGAAPGAVPVFTRKEVKKLSRVSRSVSTAALTPDIKELNDEKARLAAEERVRYEALKREQALITLAFTVVGVGMTYTAYSREVSASYLVGALAGFAYLRLLVKSVDALGGESIESGIGGMAAQPRLLIPIILALGYNRFNQLFAEQVGITLQLLPMLVGFFTYKLAVITRQAKEVYDGLGGGSSSDSK